MSSNPISHLPHWQAARLAVLLDALDGVMVSDSERTSLTWLAGFEAPTVENAAAVIRRVRGSTDERRLALPRLTQRPVTDAGQAPPAPAASGGERTGPPGKEAPSQCDIGSLYRALREVGLSQRQIARLTGQSQSEVSEILGGRQVIAYEVLDRIVTGLGIPRELMGMSWWAPEGTYAGQVTVAETPEGVSAEMLRRHLLALGATAAFGAHIKGIGELGNLPGLVPGPLPSRVFAVHVAQVRDLTHRLGEAGKAYGPDSEVSSAVAAAATRLLQIPGTEPIKQALITAVAELHLHAGWAASDAGLYNRAMTHYARALELATKAGDAYVQAHALTLAGFAAVEHGHPNDGLKMLQLAQVKAWQVPSDDRRGVAVQAWAQADSATALAALGKPEAAHRELSEARELWQPTSTDLTGDLDGVAALLEVERGRLDIAEPLAASSVRRWEELSRLGRTRSGVTLATIHVRSGESDSLQLSRIAIVAVSELSSVRARRRLEPLAAALEARPGSDTKELARMARQVAMTRA